MGEAHDVLPGPRINRRQFLQATGIGIGALTAGSLASACSSQTRSVAAKTSRGGRLRLAVVGGGSAETLDPHNSAGESDFARAGQLYEPLIWYGPTNTLEYVLADAIEPNKSGTAYTIELKRGVTWHDGSPFTADDVVYTFKKSIASKDSFYSVIATIDVSGLRALDAHTVYVPLMAPYFGWEGNLSTVYGKIIKNGTTSYSHPIGTGPFKFGTWTPGVSSVFPRYDGYWRHGEPYADEIDILSIIDDDTRLNAVFSNEADIASEIPSVRAASVKAGGYQLISNQGGTAGFMYMVRKSAPFSDVKVRQAMRLLAPRTEIVSVAMDGYARLGNDMLGFYNPDYPDLPQRTFDPDQAKSLLRQAGYPNLQVSLYTADFVAGVVEACTLFAGSAGQAGVKVSVVQETPQQYFASDFSNPKVVFGTSYWSARPTLTQAYDAFIPQYAGVGDVDGWNDPAYTSLIAQAARTADNATRTDLLRQSQTILYEQGDYIIPYFGDFLGAARNNVSGIRTCIQQPFSNYDFRVTSV